MPFFFWLSLVAGFGFAAGAAFALLPPSAVLPLPDRIGLAGVALAIACLAFLQFARERRAAALAAAGSASSPGEDVRQPPEDVRAPTHSDGTARSTLQGTADLERTGNEAGAPSARRQASPGEINANELRQILYEGRVDVLLRPVVDPAGSGLEYSQAVARLRGIAGDVLEPARYLRVAARCDLAALIDQIFIVRCAQIVRRALAEEREVRILCSIASASLGEEGFAAEIKSFFVGQAELAKRLILEIERWPQDVCGTANLSRLRQSGIQFCLKRLMPGPVDAKDLARRGFAYFRLDAPQYATTPQQAVLHPDLGFLSAALRAGGITVLVDHAAAERAPAGIHTEPAEGTEKRALLRLRSRAA